MGESDKVLLVRLDERLKALSDKLDSYQENQEAIIAEIKASMVTQKEFHPVRRFTYAVMGMVGSAVLGGLLALLGLPSTPIGK